MRRIGINRQGVDLARISVLSLNDYASHLGIQSQEEFGAFKECFRTVFDNESYRLVRKKPDLDELLHTLSDASKGYQLFLLTNRRIESVRQILGFLGIDCFGRFTWSASEGPSEGNRKASLLAGIIQEHFDAADTAYIGDATQDVDAARASGITSIFVNDRNEAPDWSGLGFSPRYSFANLSGLRKFLESIE